MVLTFFYWLIINKENFFNGPSFRKLNRFSSSGEILLKNTDLHARNPYEEILHVNPYFLIKFPLKKETIQFSKAWAIKKNFLVDY